VTLDNKALVERFTCEPDIYIGSYVWSTVGSAIAPISKSLTVSTISHKAQNQESLDRLRKRLSLSVRAKGPFMSI